MNVLPIQVVNGGVLIPLQYLQNADQFEFELTNGHVLVKPKTVEKPLAEVHKRFPWIGMAESQNPTASQDVEEILMAEIDRRSGWTHKPDVEP
ncbi:MAG: hypothetical protein V9G20_23210 [Candidatus Promineifilaceae bacterium]|jgi:hypothetical protein